VGRAHWRARSARDVRTLAVNRRNGTGDASEASPAETTARSPQPRRDVIPTAETVVATDAELVSAFDPYLRDLTPREVLELLVANDTAALWRLRWKRMSADAFEDLWREEGAITRFPGETRMSAVRDLLRRITVGEVESSSKVLGNATWYLGLAAEELARAEERLARRRRAAA
jgi:hypothetical protein